MLIYEYKLDGKKAQYAAIDEAIRVVQFIRNKCLRLWMDGRRITKNDLQCYCAVLAKEYSFAACLNSQARQASADRAWAAISRFYENCREPRSLARRGTLRFSTTTGAWNINKPGRSSRPMDATSPSPFVVACAWSAIPDSRSKPSPSSRSSGFESYVAQMGILSNSVSRPNESVNMSRLAAWSASTWV